MHICEKMGNLKKMLKNECTPFYMFVPPVEVLGGVCDYVEFLMWVKYLVSILFLIGSLQVIL